MKITNQASITYNGSISAISNLVTGEYKTPVTITKKASMSSYNYNVPLMYQLTIANTGSVAYQGVRVIDNLGQYQFQNTTRIPLTFVENSESLNFFNNNGVREGTITATEVINGIEFTFDLPAQTVTVISYSAIPNVFAPLIAGSSITNTATLMGNASFFPLVTSLTIPVLENLVLVVAKNSFDNVVPQQPFTYYFNLLNYGNIALTTSDFSVLSDQFMIPLDNVVVTAGDSLWTNGVEYDYSSSTGFFRTNSGYISLPPATITVDSFGRYFVSPSSLLITLTGIAL